MKVKSSYLKRQGKDERLLLLACMLWSAFFCEKVKYINRIHEKVVKASQLHQIAVAKRDKKILAMTSRDIVAAEARYHRSCYRLS